jgi:hypothetical protein
MRPSIKQSVARDRREEAGQGAYRAARQIISRLELLEERINMTGRKNVTVLFLAAAWAADV